MAVRHGETSSVGSGGCPVAAFRDASSSAWSKRRLQHLLIAGFCAAATDASADEPATSATTAACPATASADLVVEASRLHELGERARTRHDWATALTFYQQSQALDASATTQARIGECLEHQGALIRALEAYRRAASLVCKLQVERQGLVNERLSQIVRGLEERLPALSVRLLQRTPDLALELDQRLLTPDVPAAALAMDPGSHSLTLSAPGFFETLCTFAIAERERIEVRVAQAAPEQKPNSCQRESAVLRVLLIQEPAKVAETRGEAPSAGPVAAQPSVALPRALGFAVGGAGAVSMGVAAYFGIRTLSLVSGADCDAHDACSVTGAQTINKARGSQTAGFVAAGIGTGLLAIGLAFLLTPEAPEPPHDSPRPTKSVLHFEVDGQGLGVRSSW